MKSLFYILLFQTLHLACQAQNEKPVTNNLASRYWYLIEAPHAPDAWNEWRKEICQWKDSLRNDLHFNEHYYSDPAYHWAAAAYACLFLMANDRALYDSSWHYDIKKMLRKYETSYGGADIVLLWATYPQLGFDNRDQYEFYRNLPGGTPALKKLGEALHRMGKKFFIAYNPWDNIARNNGKNDEAELIRLVQEIGADGIFLDTISSVAGFREKLDAASPGVVFQSEMSPDPAMLPEVQQSWMEVPVWNENMKNAEYNEVPYVLRSRWLEQRHMTYHLSRWSHEQSGVIQNAWMNGCGVVVWENIFGSMNPLNARDRSLLRAMLPLLRRYDNFFTEGKWTPLVTTHLERTYASRWDLHDKTCWTIINRQEQEAMGPLLDVEHLPGTRYFDLIAGKEANTRIENGKAWISVNLKPRAIGCILALNEKELTPDFLQFLKEQASVAASASTDISYQLPSHQLVSVKQTAIYQRQHLPAHMMDIPVSDDSSVMLFHFRQRECGFYPAEGVTDISYTMALDQSGTARRKIKLHSFAMDETPVTNADFEKFLRASHYHPEYAENFLRNWAGNHPAKGQENQPVTWVSLDDARAFARWAGKRLPREEEWQWAAQSGSRYWAYPWGDSYDSTRCNHGQTNHLTDVTQFKSGRTLQGLYDMCGNVWQLTESERNDGNNSYVILKSGSWYTTHGSGWYADQGPQQANFSSKYLLTWPGLDRCATIGFRCVVDIE